jgi:hypothetical protein
MLAVLLAVAVAGVVLIAVGVGLWSLPAGLVVGGVELLGSALLGSMVEVRRAQVRPGGRR